LMQFSPRNPPKDSIPIIGTAGRLRYRYRLETLFEMSLNLDIPHRLLIVGEMDHDCKTVLREYLQVPILRSRTTYQPQVVPEALPDYYRRMNVFVHPVCGDVCPNVVIEAMACGVTVVAPRYGGTAEVIADGGVIFDCEPWRYDQYYVEAMCKAVKEALSQPDTLPPTARKIAEERYDIQTMTDRYLEALGLPMDTQGKVSFEDQHKKPSSLRGITSKWVDRPRYYLAAAIRGITGSKRMAARQRVNPIPRIAFTLYDFHVGGIENWLYRLAKSLNQEFEFYFLATKVPQPLAKFLQVGTFAFLPDPVQMIRYLKEQKIDIVQVHNQRWPVDAALAAGVDHVIERTDGSRSCTRIPKYGLSLIIASSQGTIPMIGRNFPKARIKLVYNGIDLEEVDRADTQKVWGEDAFVIGRASRFGRGKNLAMLIEAVGRLKVDHPQLKLLLIGGDSSLPGAEPMEAELRTQAEPFGDTIRFIGYQENPLPWTKGFDIGVCVSNPGNEGIPNSLLEAMACSKPVIATDVDQINELVVDGCNGVIIPPGDTEALIQAIDRMIRDPELCKRMGMAGRKVVEDRFSLPSSAHEYAQIYRSFLKNG
jgi:glycosyltransferase involved in cell wall biosynthesis